MSTITWKSSLFGCSPSCDCLKGCLCPCWLYGNIMEQKFGASCVSNCLLYLICTPCCGACAIHGPKRTEIRQSYNLNESCGSDRLVTCCCGPCALCQEKREIDERGSSGAPAPQTMG